MIKDSQILKIAQLMEFDPSELGATPEDQPLQTVPEFKEQKKREKEDADLAKQQELESSPQFQLDRLFQWVDYLNSEVQNTNDDVEQIYRTVYDKLMELELSDANLEQELASLQELIPVVQQVREKGPKPGQDQAGSIWDSVKNWINKDVSQQAGPASQFSQYYAARKSRKA